MKRVIFYIFTFAFLLGFANADSYKLAKNDQSSEISCPYLQSISVEDSDFECPYLIEKSKSSNQCPYFEKQSSGLCPFGREMNEENVKIQKEPRLTIELKSS